MQAELQREHQWLHKLVGTWSMEAECSMGPDQPPAKTKGTEVVRSLGGMWTIGEGEGEMPGSEAKANSIMTLGFDPGTTRFVGTFVVSCMAQLWVYHGSLDAAEKVLTLDTEGPSFTGNGTAKYQDTIEFLDDDHRTLSSQLQTEDGQWVEFMTAHYRRVT